MRAGLMGDALRKAVGTPGSNVSGVVFHSGRGTQYTSEEYAELCEPHGILQSVGRTGVCWDNAPAESFLAALKKELVYRRTFKTRAEARLAIRHWVEACYSRRLHSRLGYQTPIEWEDHYRHTTETLAAYQRCLARGGELRTTLSPTGVAFTPRDHSRYVRA